MTVNKLKATYSILYEAIENSKLENGHMRYWKRKLRPDGSCCANNGGNIGFANRYILPYVKTSGTLKKWYKVDKSVTAGFWHYLYWPEGSDGLPGQPVYILPNGVHFTYTWRNEDELIVIDINGPKKPNRVGIDLFTFEFNKKKNELVPLGYGRTRDMLRGQARNEKGELIWYNDTCTNETGHRYYGGGACAALIMMDGWQIKDDYPWVNGNR